jgi:hypothetical protein
VIVAGSIALLLCSCNATGTVTPEQESAIDRQIDCYHREAQRLDDGFSDPLSVGSAVRSACFREEEAAIAAMAGPWISYDNAQRLRFKIGLHDTQTAAEMVLIVRKQKVGT